MSARSFKFRHMSLLELVMKGKRAQITCRADGLAATLTTMLEASGKESRSDKAETNKSIHIVYSARGNPRFGVFHHLEGEQGKLRKYTF
jgi:hypothetical protein